MTRINKYISESGICSRREADKLIEEGKVTVNGEKAELGTKVSDGDDIKIDGKKLSMKRKTVHIAFNKPVGVVCTTDRTTRNNIIDFIKFPERVFPFPK